MTQRKRTIRCSECPVNEYCSKCWTKYKARQTEKVRYRRAHGLCIWCGAPAAPSRLNRVGAYCKEHKARRQVWGKGYRVRVGTVPGSEPENDLDPLVGTHVQNRSS